MSKIVLKEYQENAIIDLRNKVNLLLHKEGNRICQFKSPTGSGKTLMVAEWMMRFCDPLTRTDGRRFAFIWIAVHKLHDQSHDNLKKYYSNEGFGLKCSYFNELEDKQIKQNEILFLNWASINNEDKIIVRANERDNNLSSIIERTKEAGLTLILIIDESHHTAKSENAKRIISGMGPKITIELSATPQIADFDERVLVEIEDVKKEEMIKKEIIINKDFEKVDPKKADAGADEFVLKEALKTRIELAKRYKEAGSTVNPLLLIQLPDKKEGVLDKKEQILSLLANLGYTTKNRRLAVYLSEKDSKINLENIEKNENEVEVMIFKQAIALGWDCPRASMLVLFRQWREENITFSIQTLGRIMRMPEQKHYAIQDLNVGYVFTSLPDIKVANDINSKYYIKPLESKRISSYKNIDLLSYHSKRFREETRLSSDFEDVFFNVANKQNLKGDVSFKHSILKTNIVGTGSVKDIDKQIENIEKKGILSIPKTELELQYAYDAFIMDNLAPFSPETRSIKRIGYSIYKYFEAGRDEDKWPEIQAMVLAKENNEYFINVINESLKDYQLKVGKGKKELIKNDIPWNVPEILGYSREVIRKNYKKSVLNPCYFEKDSEIEVDFIDYLEKSKNVEWWFKNGKSDATYFAVPHIEHGEEKPFYVDFIVQLKNGRVGLFDTKGGLTAETAKSRAEGLAKYIAEQKENKKIFGGIVLKDKNSWRINDNKKYSYNPNNLKDWKFLDF